MCCFGVGIASEGGILSSFFNIFKIIYSQLAFLLPILSICYSSFCMDKGDTWQKAAARDERIEGAVLSFAVSEKKFAVTGPSKSLLSWN